MKQSDSIIVGPDPFRFLVLIGLGGVGIAIGVSLILNGLCGRIWLVSSGWIFIAALGAVVGLWLAGLIRQRPRIEIGPEGFSDCSLFSSRSQRWSDVDGDFAEIKLGLVRGIGYKLTQEFKQSSGRKPKTLPGGYDEAISGPFNVSRLVKLLNQHKQQ